MNKSYLGTLDYTDPLYEILLNDVFPDVREPVFHVDRISHRRVFKYTEEKSRIAIVGKFFRLDDVKQERVLRIKGNTTIFIQLGGMDLINIQILLCDLSAEKKALV